MIFVNYLFVCVAGLSFLKLEKKLMALLFFLFGFILLLIVTFRSDELPDYSVYLDFFNQGFNPGMELSFNALSYISKNVFNDFSFLLFVYAILALAIKIRVIYKYSPLPFLCLLVYLSHFFILNELVQMRAGIASAFLLLSIQPLKDRNFKIFFLCIMLATFFHYSSAILIFIYFVKPDRFSLKFYFFVTIVSLIVYVTSFSVLGSAGDMLNEFKRISIYLNGENPEEVEYSFFPITRWACFVLILFYIKYKGLKDQYVYILVNIYFASLCALLIFNQVPAIGIRYSELFGIVEILLLPLLANLVRPRFIGVLCVIFYCIYIYYSTRMGILDKM